MALPIFGNRIYTGVLIIIVALVLVWYLLLKTRKERRESRSGHFENPQKPSNVPLDPFTDIGGIPYYDLTNVDFKAMEFLAKGFEGKVYKTKLNQKDYVAIKMAVKRKRRLWATNIEKEIKYLNKLEGIVGVPKLYGVLADPKLSPLKPLGFIMDFCGDTYKQWLKKPREDSAIIKVLQKTANIIYKIHQKGLSHNDLHRKNVLVGKNDTVTVIDFGYMKKLGTKKHRFPSSLNMAKRFTLKVTPLDPGEDISSLGAIMLDTLRALANDEMKLKLKELAKQCQNGRRFHNMDEVSHRLDEILSE